MLTETRPISVAVKPLSTQNGLTMKPIEASASLKIRMKASTGMMPGRLSRSINAPNIGPCRASFCVSAPGARRAALASMRAANAVKAIPHAYSQK